MKKIHIFLYYAIVQYLPMQPFPGYKIFYRIRYYVVKRILNSCGEGVVVKNKCYFGDGSRLTVGNRTQLGQNAKLGGKITLGNDVLMGPDVVMMAVSHVHDRTDIPINQQGSENEKEILIGNDVWIGTRAIILPGVKIGSHSIVAAGAVVTQSFDEYSIIGGVPARLIKKRV